MGRKKIQITRIQDERNRQITFSKRKAGLLKKAYELSILCDVDIAVIMITHNSKLYQYASSNMNSILIRYTEFKDPDESKTNADILEDITKKEKSGRDDSGDEDDQSSHIPLTPNTQAHYHRIDEEFDHVLHQNELSSAPVPSPVPLPSMKIPQAMPVSVPVTNSLQRIGSAGSSHADSPITPGSIKTQRSPQSGGSMPPPVGTPTRLQAIRSHTLKLHLPGGGRNYIPLGSAGKSPLFEDGEGGEREDEIDGTSGRPQLRVVIPGQKGFVSRSVPYSPPLEMNNEEQFPTSSDEETLTYSSSQPTITTKTISQPPPVTVNTGSLTTPIMSLTTPSLFSSIPPGLSNFNADIPGLGDLGSASALVAFPVNIQPSSSSNSTPGGGPSNIIIQAQNAGQPFLLTPSMYNKQQTSSTAVGPSHLLTPPTTMSGNTSSLRDLEQLKLQYDHIYQQISQTLQQHQTSHAPISEAIITSPLVESLVEEEEEEETVNEMDEEGLPSSKRAHLDASNDIPAKLDNYLDIAARAFRQTK